MRAPDFVARLSTLWDVPFSEVDGYYRVLRLRGLIPANPPGRGRADLSLDTMIKLVVGFCISPQASQVAERLPPLLQLKPLLSTDASVFLSCPAVLEQISSEPTLLDALKSSCIKLRYNDDVQYDFNAYPRDLEAGLRWRVGRNRVEVSYANWSKPIPDRRTQLKEYRQVFRETFDLIADAAFDVETVA